MCSRDGISRTHEQMTDAAEQTMGTQAFVIPETSFDIRSSIHFVVMLTQVLRREVMGI